MSQFRDYVTSTAFALSISRRQIECLCHVDQLGHSWLSLPTYRALEHKGLVERTTESQHSSLDNFGTTVQLTEAGRHVIPLLKLAGLYVKLPKFPEAAQVPPIDVVVKLKDRESATNAEAGGAEA